ncbi:MULTISPECIES: amino acid ABC transporter ATP-binding protein [Curtobacterium]|jgi:ABC-type polar amino acid transport system ATPase subunit|uniref:Amino acid ABC transporter ATP-binding protein n=1 Tax=Curtobacterium flaccumfaciens pv. flaccumfaciens TaxID=138532 RepID=A0A9Q2W0K8_9MICO|nr:MULTISPECIES: amino acid ABC transporter ATP-binding protein [Curtobacterium]MBT1540686.1 amino acid ABC transporter ATP-binding protein [Curtobacterium flaccumfaciens pv. flaccumfaciens]MBT1670740.1 amino acid ABC transporter ATP-binding protein [Curtobacterium flaccumfaciens pv. flaccumfaciens]MCS6565236.1 amino acid ABC transporter ATP-binding protein [Curtobacterium flaccumfaciens pv. flaccumfaciens]MCS6577048.1 amino acid ABC transporter ATP-binding protein [Curtobacterium flaccumfacien
MSAAISIHGAVKAFGDTVVVDGVDLSLPSGSVTVVLGPSGSGKSTLLRAINHLEPLDRGVVTVGGETIGVRLRTGRDGVPRWKELPERHILRQRSRIGFVFQHFNLFPHLTALENVAEGPIAAGVPRAVARDRAAALLERVGLGDRGDTRPRQLSGGQQQRVAIARALALEPSVVLLDEPTSALDPELVGEVLGVIRGLADTGTTLVIVTHEIAFAREVADHVVFLDHGRVVEQGPPAQVLDHPQHTRTRDFLSRVR